MPSSKLKLCQCTLYNCFSKLAINPDTGAQINGCYLKPTLHTRHAREQQLWVTKNQPDYEEELANQLMATTLENRELSDATVTRESASFEDYETEAGSDDPPTSTHASDFIPQSKSRTPSVDVSADKDHIQAKLKHYRFELEASMHTFLSSDIALDFHRNPTSADEDPPRLSYTSRQRSSNKTYLDYEDKIKQLIDAADSIDLSGIGGQDGVEARNMRRELIKELQEQEESLDSVLRQQWEMKKSECGFGDAPEDDFVHDTCAFIL